MSNTKETRCDKQNVAPHKKITNGLLLVSSSKSALRCIETRLSLSVNTITGLHTDDLRQSNGHPTLTSRLRAHGLSFDDRSASPPETPNVPYTEYAFVESQQLLSLSSEDIAFLTSKDSLSLPASDAIDEFVQQYFKRIHPLVPVLDEAGFWRMFRENQSTGPKISVFVLQSMLFASCPFVSLKTLRQCGFVDRRDARKKLYNRAKLLFDLRTECRSHPNAQGAVLLTHYTSADDPQSGSLWVTRAIKHATLIDTEPSLLVENVAMSLKKRLWWSILLRDRSLCIGLRRRPQVTSISLHGCSDWLSTEDFSEELHQSQVYDYNTKKRLFEALQNQCELAVLLTDLASLAFTHQKTPRRLLSMIEFQGILLSIKNIKRSLDEWKLPVQPASSPGKTSTSEGNDAVSKLTYMTYMYYHAARVDLAQYAAFILEENLFYAGDKYNNLVLEISNDLRNGIEGLSLVMEHFSINGYADSLPLSVLGYLSMPLVLAAIDLKLSPSREEAEARQRRLHSLCRIIRHSEILYDITDRVAVVINHMLQLAYSITQNLFLERKPSQLFSSDSIVRENTVSNTWHPARATSKSTPPRPNCPESWQDAFIRCPRAYLLISTSVDYTLAIGSLPSANVLPEIVRDLPAMGIITRLPWTSDIPFSESTSSLVSCINQAQQQIYPVSLHSSCVEWIDALEPISKETEPETKITSQRVQINCDLSPDAFFEYSATPSLALEEQLQYINRVAEKTGCETTAPNLDFMEFGDCQGVVSYNVMETCAFGTPLGLTGHNLQAEMPLEQHVFDTYGTPLPQPISAHFNSSFTQI
ncbi:Transcription factor [Penicillium cf. griseofulvum]|nr:Transcription factor [Penicillium cf. griseofulvum]